MSKATPRILFSHLSTVFVRALVCMAIFCVGAPTLARSGTIRISADTGLDSSQCGTVSQPCKTLQYGVLQANSGDVVLVAEGIYYRTTEPCNRSAVVCISRLTPNPSIPYVLTVRGGYTPDDWDTPDPENNPTVIDGENQYRGIFLRGTVPNRDSPDLFVTISGFTIRNCFSQGAGAGTLEDVTEFGAGLFADFARVDLSEMIFRDNRVEGGDTVAAGLVGGAGAGGGMALRGSGGSSSPSVLDRVVFEDNIARGGDGIPRGGIGFGGGLFTNDAVVIGSHLVFSRNSATGGDSTGIGVSDGEDAGSQGGAIAVQVLSDVTLEDVVIADNISTGGQAALDAGGGGGGGILVEKASLTLRRANIHGNVAQGGDATGPSGEGGLGAGGAIFSVDANLTIEQVFMVENQAVGGFGSSVRGAAGGGAGYLTASINATYPANFSNCVIANNYIEQGAGGAYPGGGGGGFWIQGVTSSFLHTTFAQNDVGMYLGGTAMLVVPFGTPAPTVIYLDYNLVADHPNATALEVLGSPSGQANINLFADNNTDVSGSLPGLETSMFAEDAGFLNPGPSSFDYGISSSSPAVDAATGSEMAVDIDGSARVGTPDIGAWESGSGGRIFDDSFESGDTSAWSSG